MKNAKKKKKIFARFDNSKIARQINYVQSQTRNVS